MDVRMPNGTIIKNVPNNITKQELETKLKANNFNFNLQPQPQEGTAGIGEALIGGTKRLISSGRTFADIFNTPEQAALSGIERGKNITERPGASLEAVKNTYNTDGVLSAAGEVASQVPGAVAEQVPFLASMAGGGIGVNFLTNMYRNARGMAKITKNPYAILAGSLLAPMFQAAGSAMERRAEEQTSRGERVNINRLKAAGVGVGSAALERASLGLSGLSRVMRINIMKPAVRNAEALAKQNIARVLATGGGKLIAAEVPTEVGQQMLERYYADLPLLNDEAKKEYVEAAYGAALLAPLGGVAGVSNRSQARNQFQQEQQVLKDAEDRRKIIQQEEKIKQDTERSALEAQANEEAQATNQAAEDIQFRQEAVNEIINPTLPPLLAPPKVDLIGTPSGVIYKSDQEKEEYLQSLPEEERAVEQARLLNLVAPTKAIYDRPINKDVFKSLGIGNSAIIRKNKKLDGLDPNIIEDNEVIRTILTGYKDTLKSGSSIIPKVETYLRLIPSKQNLIKVQEGYQENLFNTGLQEVQEDEARIVSTDSGAQNIRGSDEVSLTTPPSQAALDFGESIGREVGVDSDTVSPAGGRENVSDVTLDEAAPTQEQPTKKVRPIIEDALKVDELLIQFEEIDVADNYQGLGDSYNNAESLEQAINQNPAYTDEYIIKEAEYHLDKSVTNLPENLTGDKENDAMFRREIKQLKKFLKKYKDVKPTQEAQPAAAPTPRIQESRTAPPKTYTFEGKPIPQKLIDQHRKMQENDEFSYSAMSYGKGSQRSSTIINSNFIKQQKAFLGQGDSSLTTRGREFDRLLDRINRPGQSATVPFFSVDGTVRYNDQAKQDPRDAANFEDIQESRTETEGVVPTFEGKEIPQSLIDAYIKSETATDRAETDASFNFGQIRSAATRLLFKLEEGMEGFLGLTFEQYQTEIEKSSDQNRVGKLERALGNILGGKPVGYDYFASPIIKMSRKNVENTVNYKIDRSLIDKARKNNLLRESGRESYLETKDIQESRTDTEGTGQTAATVLADLVEEFGNNINKMIEKGKLVIVDNVSQLPDNVTMSSTANGAYDPTTQTSYIVANRIQKGQGRRVLLHEIGEHYGLEKMVGKDYMSLLNRLKTLRKQNAEVQTIFDEVQRQYPELEVDSKPFLQEVMAKLGEKSPNNTLFRRMVGAVKNFLRRLGLYNVNNFNDADIQDMILNSLRVSLAETTGTVTREQASGIPALQMSKNTEAVEYDEVNGIYLGTKVLPEEKALMDKMIKYFTDKLNIKDSNVRSVWEEEVRNNRPDFGAVDRLFHQTMTGYDKFMDSISDGVTQLPLNKSSLFIKDPKNNIYQYAGESLAIKIAKTRRLYPYYDEFGNKVEPTQEARTDTNIQFSKADEYSPSTSALAPNLPPVPEVMLDRLTNIIKSVKDAPKDSLMGLFTKLRTQIAYSGAGVQEELMDKYNNAITDSLTGKVRADIAQGQSLSSNVMAAQAAESGFMKINEFGIPKVVDSDNNLTAAFNLRDELGKKIGATQAYEVVHKYLEAARLQEEIELNAQRQERRDSIQESISKIQKAIKVGLIPTSIIVDGKTKKVKRIVVDNEKFTFMEAENQVAKLNKIKGRIKDINPATPDQLAAMPEALLFINKFPEIKKISEILREHNINQVNFLESTGIYSKEKADEYRKRKSYVPLYRVMEDLESENTGAKQYFSGFVDLGKEYDFEGDSDKTVTDILDNVLTQHFWATNAGSRNNAHILVSQELAIRDASDTDIEYYDSSPTSKNDETYVPIYKDGERKYIGYTDPTFATSVTAIAPATNSVIKMLGKVAKVLRISITANPIFQGYQVFNDAIGSALISGNERPFELMGRILKGAADDSFTKAKDPINKQMEQLGIAGGYGHTAEDISQRARIKLGISDAGKFEKGLDWFDRFAAKSDLAQRRGIFEQTLIETGGAKQPDGSIVGGNEILAMNRALDIINWQKRGASPTLRLITSTIPFANAYIQGQDVLLSALRGKGISGQQRKQAIALLIQTSLKMYVLNTIYAMLVAGDDEYEELSDREKLRSYVIPGTGLKVPVRAELSLLLKMIPELGTQYYTKKDTEDEIDTTKIWGAVGDSLGDALLGPTLFPQAGKGILEATTNHSFFTGQPLVDPYTSKLKTSEQFNAGTSELAKLIGQTGIISPIKMDHIMRSFFGTAGALSLYMIDGTANIFYDEKLPTTPWDKHPLIGPLLYSKTGRDSLNDYYELKDLSDEVFATFNRMVKSGKSEDAKEYLGEGNNKKLLGVRNYIKKAGKNLKTLRDYRKQVVNSNLGSSEKRKLLNKIDKQNTNVVRQISKARLKAGL